MKLLNTQTETTSTDKNWEYALTQIDTTKITQLRVALYDNAPKLNHFFEKSRYRAEVQLWTDKPHNAESNYKLFSYMSNFKSFKNNQWKASNDQHKDWYVREVGRAKVLNEEYSADATIGHCCLSMNKLHSGWDNGSFGQYNMPRYSMHMLATEDNIVCQLSIEDYQFEMCLDKTSDKVANAKLYYYVSEVGQ